MALQESQLDPNLKLSDKHHIAIVVGKFNSHITNGLHQGAKEVLIKSGLPEKNIQSFHVPGAFELPLFAKKCAQTKKYDAIICLGTVIRGDTSHYDYVCEAATHGLTQAILETEVPMAFGVLTVDHESQAIERSLPNKTNKGRESAIAMMEMIFELEKI